MSMITYSADVPFLSWDNLRDQFEAVGLNAPKHPSAYWETRTGKRMGKYVTVDVLSWTDGFTHIRCNFEGKNRDAILSLLFAVGAENVKEKHG